MSGLRYKLPEVSRQSIIRLPVTCVSHNGNQEPLNLDIHRFVEIPG